MSDYRYYPEWCYSINENHTRARKAEYDRQRAAIEKRCIAIAPNYYQRHMRERYAIYKQACDELGY